MNFVKLNAEGQPAEWPVTMDRIRFDNPRVSFPKNPAVCDFSSYGFGPFRFSDKPDFDSYLQNIEEIEPVLSDGVWVQSWSVTEKYSESEKAEKIAEREAAALAKKREGLVVTMRQARLALAKENKLQLVNDAIALIPEPDRTTISIEWEYASTVERLSPWIDIMATALGMTDVEMDALFELATTL